MDKNMSEERIDKLLEELENTKALSQESFDILAELRYCLLNDEEIFKYSNCIVNFMKEVGQYSNDIVPIWNLTNAFFQSRYPEILERVLDNVEDVPEEAVKVFENTFDKEQICFRPRIIQYVLEKYMDSDENTRKVIYQQVLQGKKEVIDYISDNVLKDGIKVLVDNDILIGLNVYNLTDKSRLEKLSLDKDEIIENTKKYIVETDDVNELIYMYCEMEKTGLFTYELEILKDKIEKIVKEDPLKIQSMLHEEIFAEDFIVSYLEGIADRYVRGESIPTYRTKYSISVEDLERLVKDGYGSKIPPEIKMSVQFDKMSQIHINELQEIKSNIEKFKNTSNFSSFSYDEMVEINNRVDEILYGIDRGNKADKNREMKIFVQVVKRLARNIKYSTKMVRFEDKSKKLNRKINTVRNKKRREKMEERSSKLASIAKKSHMYDEYGALVNGKAVCDGISKSVELIFSRFGIENKRIIGLEKPGKPGHSWNQIKIDGVWYNLDLTWDRESLLLGCPASWLLKSDKEFRNHKEFSVNFAEFSPEKCDVSMRKETITKHINKGFKTIKGVFRKENKDKKWLLNIAKNTRYKDVCKFLPRLERQKRQRTYEKEI